LLTDDNHGTWELHIEEAYLPLEADIFNYRIIEALQFGLLSEFPKSHVTAFQLVYAIGCASVLQFQIPVKEIILMDDWQDFDS